MRPNQSIGAGQKRKREEAETLGVTNDAALQPQPSRGTELSPDTPAADAALLVSALASRVEQLMQRCDRMQEDNSRLHRAHQEDLRRLCDAHRDDMRTLQERVSRLGDDNKSLAAALAAFRREHDEATGDHERTKGELEALGRRADRAEREMAVDAVLRMFNDTRYYSDEVKELVRQTRDVNAADKAGGTLLEYAACSPDTNRCDLIEALVAAGANIHARGDCGETPLYHAARYNRVEAAKGLIAAGADINASDEDGVTPVHIATQRGNLEMVRLLVAANACLEFKDQEGYTPLARAIGQRLSDIAKVLITGGADVNSHGRNGYTPLIVACCVDVPYIAEALLDAGADPSQTINEDKWDGLFCWSPLQTASKMGHRKIIDMLKAAGAVAFPDSASATHLIKAEVGESEASDNNPSDPLKRCSGSV